MCRSLVGSLLLLEIAEPHGGRSRPAKLSLPFVLKHRYLLATAVAVLVVN
jgi:hypothetical protein